MTTVVAIAAVTEMLIRERRLDSITIAARVQVNTDKVRRWLRKMEAAGMVRVVKGRHRKGREGSMPIMWEWV